MARKSSVKNKEAKAAKKHKDKKGKTKQAEYLRENPERTHNIVLFVMLVVLASLIFVGPFQRGLFFTTELLPAQVVAFSLLIFWGISRIITRDRRLIESPLDICLALLLVAYFISFFVAVSKRDALEELLKIATYLVVYLAAFDLCRYWKYPWTMNSLDNGAADQETKIPPGLNILLHMLLVASTVLTIASLGVAAGNWDFVGAYASNRIASPMGYANTAAAYFMATYLMSLALAPLAAKKYRFIYLAPAALMLFTVVLTFSRGAWLLLPPLAILLIVTAAPGQRLRSGLYLAVTGLVAVPAAFMTDPVFRSDSPGQAWLIIIAAVVSASLLGILVELYFSQSRKLRVYIAVSGIGIAALVLIVGMVIPLVGPLHLERGTEEEARVETYEQVISNIEAGETYRLELHVNADTAKDVDSIEQEYIWGVKVLGGLPEYRTEELFRYEGDKTEGWTGKEFTFETNVENIHLDVQIYNRYPGTSVTVRDVTLVSPASEHKLNFTMNRLLPDRFYSRLYSFSLDRNMDRRVELFQDAIKVIRDYPLFGAGGGAWASVYKSYQDQHYDSREVHNHYLQVWIEAGVFGFLAFVGIWVSLIAAFIRNCSGRNASTGRWQYWTAVFIPVAALGAHSVIDWNFSMAAVGIFLFVLLGASRGLDQVQWFRMGNPEKQKRRTGLIIGAVAVLAGLSLSIFSAVLWSGLETTRNAQDLMNRGNLKQAVIEKEKAIRLDPFRAENYHNLGVIIESRARQTQSWGVIERVLMLAERAYELEPYELTYIARYGSLLMSYVDDQEGLYYIDKMVERNPFSVSSYRQAAFSRLQVAEHLMEEGKYALAEQYLEEAMEFEPMMKERLGHADQLKYIMGRANYLLGDQSKAEQYYEEVPEGDQFYSDAQQRLEELQGEDEGND
ncbi:MAG: O-antigen ligase family protein [Bacillota bacterium]